MMKSKKNEKHARKAVYKGGAKPKPKDSANAKGKMRVRREFTA